MNESSDAWSFKLGALPFLGDIMNLDYIKSILSQASFHEWYGGSWKKYGASDMDCYPIEEAYMIAITGTCHWKSKNSALNWAEFKKVCNIIYPKYQDQDGKTHINIYSRGKTDLGRFLSNFTKHRIDTEDGKFDSIEGYWYWLGCKDEKLRTLSGWEAKQYGRKVRAADWNNSEDFKRKICGAIENKIRNSKYLNRFTNNDLPLEHYYVYGDKVVKPEEGKWVIEYLLKLRVELRIQQNEEYEKKKLLELEDREYKEYLRLKAKYEKS